MNTKHEKFRNKNHTHIRCWNPTTPSPCPHADATFYLPSSAAFLWRGAFHVANGNRRLENEIRFAICTHANTHTHTNTNHPHAALWASANRLRNSNYEFCLQSNPDTDPETGLERDADLEHRRRRRLFAHELLNCAHLPRIRLTAPAYPLHSALVTVKFLLAMRDAKRQRFVSTDGQFSIFQAQLEMNKAEREDSPWRNDSRRNSRFTHWMQCICSLLLSKAQHVYSPKGQNAGPLGPQQGPQPPHGPQGAPTGAQGPAPTDQGP